MAEKGVGLFVGPTKRGKERERESYRECVNLCKREAMRTPGKRVFTADPVAGGKKQTDKISCRRPASVKLLCFS